MFWFDDIGATRCIFVTAEKEKAVPPKGNRKLPYLRSALDAPTIALRA
jgi:hypothetical protein